MNEIKMEKMTEMEALCGTVVLELIEIKHHLCNGRELEGGVGLGGLIKSLLYRKAQEEEKRNEEVQDEECDEECEESEEEEEEEDYDESRLVQELRRDIEESAHGKLKLISECSEKDSQLRSFGILVMDFQDLFIKLLSHKRINKLDVHEVIRLLKRSGIDNSDLKVRAGQKDEQVHEECKEGEEEEDYKAMYIGKSEEFLEQGVKLTDLKEENTQLKSLNNQSFELIKKLYIDDQTPLDHKAQLKQLLLKTDAYIGRYVG